MEAFLVSTGIVALAEIGDKTQLLSILLAARFRKPVPIILGIFISTLVNHALAGAVGGWITHMLGENVLRWILGVGFIAMAGWMLIPDKLDDDEAPSTAQRGLGILGTTIVAFFFAEMGDKTQIATVALAARFNDVFSVVAGTTVGMLLANVPAVLMGNKFAARMPITLVHRIAALIFLVLGVLALLGVGK
ncbi:TMEM165/GDT1 family protein [Ralstonia mojiangensis]|uniref:GDT1 family protein n=1 Tax=Ralstonia mojiangensis TaxID=2953895 RepID=A0ABT2LFV5_9RALS|nr:TMEM165/GDT1 family protein [Ralstonia mojiangensis]MCO5410845.1 TMEM165/GDT1 family protein [Ralstonia mojiangensis]MCT7295251.1 TMEM165/GDT1 family protein [Ralstonia mojiangensis]MCT7313494.1 TMEM165/GDT1 family protein [Ralstonia mojiangensis]